MGKAGCWAASVAFVFLFSVAFFGGLEGQFLGNGHWQSAVYAMWDSILAVGLSLWAITFFRRRYNRESSMGSFLTRQSYTVYIIHCPIIVYLAIALQGIDVQNALKFAIVSCIVIPVSFLVASLIRKLPGASRIL